MSTHHDDEPPAKRAREEEQTKHAEDDAVPAAADPAAAAASTKEGEGTEPSGGGGGGEAGEPGSAKNKKRKVAMFLAYVGKGYQGFQRNPGALTIEDELERAIVAAGGISEDNAGDFNKVGWSRAARTDKGVSAVGQCISLRMMLDPPGIIDRINEKLPEGFEFFGYTRVTAGFNAKTMCDRRRYEYVIPTKAFDPRQCRPRRDIEAEAALASQDDGLDDASAAPFVFDEAARARVNKVLGNYCGTHNFHNYTVRVDPNDPSAMRYIISFECSMPFVVDGVEFVRCTVVGQSFMLHQIRKLIGTMLGVMRGAWTEDDQIFALKTKESVNTPMAPELGLFLCETIYHAYNTRYDASHEPLLLGKYDEKVEVFKRRFIYPHMAKTEKEEETMEGWIRMLPVRQVLNSIAHARKRDGGRAYEGKSKKRKGGPDKADEKRDQAPSDANQEKGEAPADAAMTEPVHDKAAAPAVEAPAAATATIAQSAPLVESAAEKVCMSDAANRGEVANVQDVPPPPPLQPARSPGGAGRGYARPDGGRSARGGNDGGRGGRGGRTGSGGRGGGARGGKGRGRGPKNQVRNAHMKSNDDFDPAELSD